MRILKIRVLIIVLSLVTVILGIFTVTAEAEYQWFCEENAFTPDVTAGNSLGVTNSWCITKKGQYFAFDFVAEDSFDAIYLPGSSQAKTPFIWEIFRYDTSTKNTIQTKKALYGEFTYTADTNDRVIELLLDGTYVAGHYGGAQIRTVLVPYRNKNNEIIEGDKRQGLRFCFELPEKESTLNVNGEDYTLKNVGALVVLKERLGSVTLTLNTTSPYVQKLSDLVDYESNGKTYKSVYVYNIPKENKDTVIVTRLYFECEDAHGNAEVFYSELYEMSLTSVFNAIEASGQTNELHADAVAWWRD